MNQSIKVLSSASYFPKRVVTNDELSQIMDTSDEWIVSHTGIKERRFAIDENTSDLSAQVAEKLLKQAGVAASEVDLIILSTISPDAISPATAAIVQAKIGAENAFAYDISTACGGFIFALATAQKFIASGQYQKALVISAEVSSKMMDFKDRTSTVFFGDGAAGMLIAAADATESMYVAEKLCTKGNAEVIHSGRIQPISEISADNYPVMDAFYQDGRSVYQFVTQSIPDHIKAFLAAHNKTTKDLDLVVTHQANLRLIEFLAQELEVPLNKFAINVETKGNTSSAGLPSALAEKLADPNYQPGLTLLCGFGAGLAYGSILLDLTDYKK